MYNMIILYILVYVPTCYSMSMLTTKTWTMYTQINYIDCTIRNEGKYGEKMRVQKRETIQGNKRMHKCPLQTYNCGRRQ